MDFSVASNIKERRTFSSSADGASGSAVLWSSNAIALSRGAKVLTKSTGTVPRLLLAAKRTKAAAGDESRVATSARRRDDIFGGDARTRRDVLICRAVSGWGRRTGGVGVKQRRLRRSSEVSLFFLSFEGPLKFLEN